MKKVHRLLRRQLKKAGIDDEQQNVLAPLLRQIDKAYTAFDNDFEHVENILEKARRSSMRPISD